MTRFVNVAHDQGQDRDGDGLSDGDELSLHGTDPENGDTDGDGIADDVELASGSDPLVADLAGPPVAVPALGFGAQLALVGLLLGAALRARAGNRSRTR